MPYFVFRVHPFPVRRLELLERVAGFREASARTKALRATPDLQSGSTVRMVFAQSELEAEDLLNQLRDPAPGAVGDE